MSYVISISNTSINQLIQVSAIFYSVQKPQNRTCESFLQRTDEFIMSKNKAGCSSFTLIINLQTNPFKFTFYYCITIFMIILYYTILALQAYPEQVCRFQRVIFSWKLPHGSLSTLKQAHDVTVYHSNPPARLPLSSPPVHNHLLVSLPFAAVRIKLYIMVAITSLASWLLLTPNQHSCFLVVFIAIVGQTVCFENAKSNSLMWKKEHLIGFQCFLCWFELGSNEDRWLNLFACMCVHTQVACIHCSRLYCSVLCVHEQAASGVTAHDITQ